MKKIVTFLALVSLAFFVMIYSPVSAQFNPLDSICQNSNAKKSPACNPSPGGNAPNPVVKIIRDATDIIALVAGAAAVITIIISGFMFVTAGGASPGQRAGDPNRIKSARAALSGAIIGLLIVVLAWTIVTFVTSRFINT